MNIGLATGLGTLDGDQEEYVFLTYQGADQWLRPYVGGPCRIVALPRPARWEEWRNLPLLTLFSLLSRIGLVGGRPLPRLFQQDHVLAGIHADIIHFTRQKAFLTDTPSLYHPHDLQHLHLPQYFSRGVRRIREIRYRVYCARASLVPVASSWVRNDVLRHYTLSEEKVQVVPLAPAAAAYPLPTAEDLAHTKTKFSLPEGFVFYAAQTWPHKNHIGLLEALALLRAHRKLEVPLVCCGAQNAFFGQIEARVKQLRLEKQARFLGFVKPLELQCLYRLARAVVIPSKFEAASFPLFEAFLAETPAACSNVTSLPRQAGAAALIFDPNAASDIARSIEQLWTDEALCRELVERGREKVAQFTWARTARMFRAHYRRLAGRPLSMEDEALLAATPLV